MFCVGVYSINLLFWRKQLDKLLFTSWEESWGQAPADAWEDGLPGQHQDGGDEEQGDCQEAGDED